MVEGKVARVEQVRAWTLFHLHQVEKPLAFTYNPGVRLGDRVSVRAKEGLAWLFATHTPPAISRREEPTFIVDETYWKGRSGAVAQIWAAKFLLEGYELVGGDDVYEAVMARFPEADPRIIGLGSQFLHRRGLIHHHGYRKSKRKESHFHPKEAVWKWGPAGK